jgi:peptide/nickel transport system substrate-binding protein
VETAELAPVLATDWTVSDDGLTYTFNLREGVTFHDGTAFTSAAIEPSFQRRAEIGANGPGYMVAGVESVATPSDTQVVITLKAPNAAFLDYLASPFGPKIVSPQALQENAGEEGKAWFATHDAGTGPYTFGDFNPGTSYELTAYPDYWGDVPGYDTVAFTVRDSLTSIQLELESGETDGLLGSGEKSFVSAMQANPDLNTYLLPSMLSPMIYLNPRTPGFAEQADRLAFLSGLDFPALVDAAYGPLATSQSGVLPMRMLDASLNHNVVSYDDAALAALAAGSLKDESIEIVYSSNDPGGSNLSDNIAAALNVVGIKATSTGLDSGAFWSTVFDPEKAPDIVAFTGLPDAGHPDTWARIYYTPTGGLNLLGAEVPGVEELLDKALETGDESIYGDVTTKVSESGYWYTMASLNASAVLQKSVTGAESAADPILGFRLDLAKLKPAS